MSDFDTLPTYSVKEVYKILNKIEIYISDLSTLQYDLAEQLDNIYDIISCNEDDILILNDEITSCVKRIEQLKKEKKELYSDYKGALAIYNDYAEDEDEDKDYYVDEDEPEWILDDIYNNEDEAKNLKIKIKYNKAKIKRRRLGIKKISPKIETIAKKSIDIEYMLTNIFKTYFKRNK